MRIRSDAGDGICTRRGREEGYQLNNFDDLIRLAIQWRPRPADTIAKDESPNSPGKRVRLLDVSQMATEPEDNQLRLPKNGMQNLGPFGTKHEVMLADKDEGRHPQFL
jgi:hypothetical protein